MNLVRYRNPILGREMDRFFDDVFFSPSKNSAAFRPAYDLTETETHHLLSFDLPGLKKEDINVEVKDGHLVVSGERKQQFDRDGYRGRSFGSFYQSFSLPEGIEQNDIDAQYKDGVLELAIEKKEIKQETKRIEVKNGDVSLWDRFKSAKKSA